MTVSCKAYIDSVVGEPLAQGIAATIAAQPLDPVEYLGNWLLRYAQL